ncbi:class I SAM-dependent methyltransferase [Polluticoccus soli]|uniref:class I SAM-dependent methyltransferase n=1 Tax=Polluticoccus soli TaxID=3034150 RepID=UPI0023E1DEC8|nr:class I SAM-dependent methyltransferase [Flavipsychrobacter sp. JY13-12]
MDLKEAKFRTQSIVARHPWELARLEVVIDLAEKRLDEMNASGGVLLDMGCGDTWFVEQLSSRYSNIRCFAVDINFTDDTLEFLRDKNKHTKIQVFRTLDDAQVALGSDSVDMVLLLDVIEHIADDIAFLKWMQTFQSIDNTTQFVITVPAFQSLFSRHDVFLEHYRRYDNAMLERHINQAGLKSEKKGYFFLSLLLARAAAVFMEKATKNDKPTTGLVEWNKGHGVTAAIRNVMLFDHYFTKLFSKLGIKLPGLSNYIICRRSA